MQRDARHKIPKTADQPAGSKGHNLVVAIGIDAYEHWKKLHYAVADAKGVRDLFVNRLAFGEPIPPLRDGEATQSAILELVQDRLKKPLVQDDDSLVLFSRATATLKSAMSGEIWYRVSEQGAQEEES